MASLRTDGQRYTAYRPLQQAPRFHRLTERLYALGPRPVGEALLLVAAGRDLFDVLEEYAALDPQIVNIIGARDWPPVPMGRVA